jgi:hypothetical protein
MYRLDEVDVIHGRGHNVGARVPVGGHGAGHIDEVHQPSAQQIAQRVGVVGQDEFSHLGLGAGHGARNWVGRVGILHGTHDSLTPFTARRGCRLRPAKPAPQDKARRQLQLSWR